jgi:hypothetical protein
MAKESKQPLELPLLPKDFNIEQHLMATEHEAEGIKFVAKVLGEQNGQVLCETIDGIFEFKCEDVIEVKPLHSQRDSMIINIDAQYILHSTLARLLRSQRELLARNHLMGQEGQKMGIPGVAWDGNHEWRGVEL